MVTTWAKSAAKHGISREDVYWAMSNARLIDENFKDERFKDKNLIAFVGAQRDPKKPELEIIAILEIFDNMHIIHVMHARESFIKKIKGGR